MQNISERIKEIRTILCEGSNIEFAKIMNVKTNTTSNWVSGGREIGFDVIEQIIKKFPQIDANWLLKGEGEMMKGNINTINSNGSLNNNIAGSVVGNNVGTDEGEINALKARIAELEARVKELQNDKAVLQSDKIFLQDMLRQKK